MSVSEEAHPTSVAWTLDVRERLRDYAQLAKARLSSMVLMSALVGYWLASGDIALSHLMWFTAGTFLVVAGANAFNQVLERESDSRMERTSRRPLPAGRMTVAEATLVASLMSSAGVSILFVTGGALCGGLSVAALVTYALIYTPLKSKTAWATLPGAVAGAIPPLMGFSAVQGSIGPLGWCLFAIVFFWQFPHTWAIASTYRHDYANVGHRALPLRGTRVRTVVATVVLVAVSLVPVALGVAGVVYFVGASALGALFLLAASRFGDGTLRPRAAQLLAASLFYLPLVLALLALDGKVA